MKAALLIYSKPPGAGADGPNPNPGSEPWLD